ncbi:ATP-binding cassette domain-containing protein [Gloeocapsopsis crepidinum LEGE 06123]|uniref:ATP-binding cassette domain-containing protein n=1 Tax=Gloeocapsopsis crepidinum LEGE 06123 TaxID=588587 RepID=A0ABR9UT97_9CHRO|nr:ATP-binding cassette domain-containing protein [Gloeocapsopsis crepidinum]MBE9190825.1 ATP-binding cassette domain-containing protein [Gloeocapsopsis crepidinum LEGE 06123]
MPTQLQLRQVSLSASIGSQDLLQDISFDVARGDRIAIVGPSGAGKTSLLRLLNRLSEPSSGVILFENQDYRQIPVLQLRQEIVLVPQESKLLGMTVQNAIAYPLVLRKLPKQQIQQRVSYWIETLHIPVEWLDRNELQLSVGQRQLVAIARALVIQPKILLLDEPTSALDAGRTSHLVEVLTDLATQTTILMVNHQLEIAELFCTRVLYFQQGRLIQDEPASSINWHKLRESLIQAEAKAVAEWG